MTVSLRTDRSRALDELSTELAGGSKPRFAARILVGGAWLDVELTADEVGRVVEREGAALDKAVAATPTESTSTTTEAPAAQTSTAPSMAMAPARPAAEPTAKQAEQAQAQSIQSLVELVGNLAGKLHLPDAGADESIVNSSGLPIQEIRETPTGETLGTVPGEGEGEGEGAIEVQEDSGEAYWSEEAVRRRAELRRRIFDDTLEFSDDEDEEDDEGDGGEGEREGGHVAEGMGDEAGVDEAIDDDEPTQAFPTPLRAVPATPPNAFGIDVSPPARPAPTPIAAPPAPKSILKPPPARKKSVSFDDSVPAPPESPRARAPQRLGFQLGSVAERGGPAEHGEAVGPPTVPVLSDPKPRSAGGFAGLRPGFLNRSAVPPPVTAPTRPAAPPPAPVLEAHAEPEAEAGAKKKSLFAQRREDRAPALPKLSEAKEMATMKLQVVEKPPAPASPSPGPSKPAASAVAFGSGRDGGAMDDGDGDNDEGWGNEDGGNDDDMGDLGDFSDDEEDEYMLDEAMLRREVALEFHRRQLWMRPTEEEDDDDGPGPEAGAASAADLGCAGGVMLGVPRVSTIVGGGEGEPPLRIINPTADDLANFMRVGRADDGELVFEAPLVGASSDESDGDETGAAADDRRARRERRRDVRARLLRGETDDKRDDTEVRVELEKRFRQSLPPTVQSVVEKPTVQAVVERDLAAPAQQAEQADTKPKRVSRFKAARQGSDAAP
ncbi:Nuclear envelope morphology protein 1 [Cryptotrichosporon argae]